MADEAKLSGYNLFSDEIKDLVKANIHVVKMDKLREAWLENKGWDAMIPRFLDDEYNVLPFNIFEKVMDASRTNRFLYEKFFDCDKFSRQFQAEVQTLEINSVGMVIDYSARHSYNVVACWNTMKPNNLEFFFIEPQADQVTKIHQSIYTFKEGEVIF